MAEETAGHVELSVLWSVQPLRHDGPPVSLLAPRKRRTGMPLVDDQGGRTLPDKRHEVGVRWEQARKSSGGGTLRGRRGEGRR